MPCKAILVPLASNSVKLPEKVSLRLGLYLQNAKKRESSGWSNKTLRSDPSMWRNGSMTRLPGHGQKANVVRCRMTKLRKQVHPFCRSTRKPDRRRTELLTLCLLSGDSSSTKRQQLVAESSMIEIEFQTMQPLKLGQITEPWCGKVKQGI